MNQVLFRNWLCNIHLGKYDNGRLALRLTEGKSNDPIATCTVNQPEWDYPELDDPNDRWIIVKNYSENKGMFKALLDAEIIEPVYKLHNGKPSKDNKLKENQSLVPCQISIPVFNTLTRKEGV